jgi:hypothetical protein
MRRAIGLATFSQMCDESPMKVARFSILLGE